MLFAYGSGAPDRIGDGRLTVHFITGGTDHEQRREGQAHLDGGMQGLRGAAADR